MNSKADLAWSYNILSLTEIELSAATVENGVTHLMLQHYINQAIHLLIRPALVALALRSLQPGGAPTTGQ